MSDVVDVHISLPGFRNTIRAAAEIAACLGSMSRSFKAVGRNAGGNRCNIAWLLFWPEGWAMADACLSCSRSEPSS